MQWMGFTLNQVSLLALSLVAGVLVDDAIVEIENIVRHMRMGKSGYQAALDAADEIGLAVVATSATIIAVFVPVSFMPGITGQYFIQFGLTVAAAVFFSLLVARLITPVIAAYTLKADASAHGDGPIMTLVPDVTLRWCVNHRWRTLAGGTVFFILSLVVLGDGADRVRPGVGPGELAAQHRVAARRAARGDRRRFGCGLRDTQAATGSDRCGGKHRRRRDRRSAHRATSTSPWCRARSATSRSTNGRNASIKELRKIPDARITFANQSGGGYGRDIDDLPDRR